MTLTHLSLFSGIGGIDLAAEWAGFQTVGQCEKDSYCQKVLEKHWPNVPRWRDIIDVTAESFRERTGLYTVDLITGGIPCQPFSVAGKQKGKKDERYLWPETLRVIRELGPRWVIIENVPGILRIAADDICTDLERENYDIGIFDYEAAAVGARHRRERVFFVGNAKGQQDRRVFEPRVQTDIGTRGDVANAEVERNGGLSVQSRQSQQKSIDFEWESKNLSNSNSPRFQKCNITNITNKKTQCGGGGSAGNLPDSDSIGLKPFVSEKCLWKGEPTFGECGGKCNRRKNGQLESRLGGVLDGFSSGMDKIMNMWAVEPDIPRIVTGVKDRANRLKCLGNAVVWQQVYPILAAIAQIEEKVEEKL